MSERAAGVAETVGIFARGGVEQNARGFKSLRAEDDGFRADFLDLAREAINERDAGSFVGAAVHVDVRGDSVRDQSAVARSERVFYGRERTAEIRERAAAAFARAAVVAGQAAIVRLREDGGAADGDGAAEFGFGALAKL